MPISITKDHCQVWKLFLIPSSCSFHPTSLPPKCTVGYMKGQMACSVKAESIAGLWLDEWGVRVNEGQSPPMESYPDCELQPLHFGPKNAISTALSTLRDLLQTKCIGRHLCTPSLSWHSGGDHTNDPTQGQEWNSPTDWTFEWFLIFLRAEGKPSFSMPGLMVVGARPCGQFGY